MTVKFNMTRDISGATSFGLPFPKLVDQASFNTTLAVGVAQSVTVPGSHKRWIAIFSYQPGSTVWVANNETAAVPGGAFAVTASELNPVAREVEEGDVISFITPDTTSQIGVVLKAR
jgi:hypothetical protein